MPLFRLRKREQTEEQIPAEPAARKEEVRPAEAPAPEGAGGWTLLPSSSITFLLHPSLNTWFSAEIRHIERSCSLFETSMPRKPPPGGP